MPLEVSVPLILVGSAEVMRLSTFDAALGWMNCTVSLRWMSKLE